MNHYIKQLGNKYIIVGDFNGHSRILDDAELRTNPTGKTIEQLVTNHNLHLNTPKNTYTYISIAHLTRSCQTAEYGAYGRENRREFFCSSKISSKS